MVCWSAPPTDGHPVLLQVKGETLGLNWLLEDLEGWKLNAADFGRHPCPGGPGPVPVRLWRALGLRYHPSRIVSALGAPSNQENQQATGIHILGAGHNPVDRTRRLEHHPPVRAACELGDDHRRWPSRRALVTSLVGIFKPHQTKRPNNVSARKQDSTTSAYPFFGGGKERSTGPNLGVW